MLNEDIRRHFTTVTPLSKLVAGLVFVFLPFIAFFLGIRYQQNKDYLVFSQLLKTPNNPAVGTTNESTSGVSAPEGTVQTYISQDLKISFNYFEPKNTRDSVKIKEIGNKVYLYVNYSKTKPDDPTSGKFVQVFNKNPNISLGTTVKEKFLLGFSNENCLIITGDNTINPNYEYVRIKVNVNPDESFAEARRKASLCPTDYISFNQVRYFVMDKNHPNRFAFFSLGQDNFLGAISNPGDRVITWDNTLKFID